MSSDYRVAIIGTGRMAGTIDDEVTERYPTWLPYGHVGGYGIVDETTVVAAADANEEKLNAFCDRFEVPQRFTDYGEMLATVKPDIVSITTPAVPRAGIIFAAIEAGVRGIYAVKALCCSMDEADRVRDAVHRNGVALVYGTQRRYRTGFQKMAEVACGGAIGEVRSVTSFCGTNLLHTGSHVFDTLLLLAGDPRVEYVTADLGTAAVDPATHHVVGEDGSDVDALVSAMFIQFDNGVAGHYVQAPGRFDFEINGTDGTVRSSNNGDDFEIIAGGGRYVRETRKFPAFETGSACVASIRDLVRSIETGEPTSGNIDIAHRGMAMALAAVESHVNNGARAPLPVRDRALYVASH